MANIKALIMCPTFPRFAGDSFGADFVFELTKALSQERVNVRVITAGDGSEKELKYDRKLKKDYNIDVKRFFYFRPIRFQKLAYRPGGIPVQIQKSLLSKLQLVFFMFSFFLRALPYSYKSDIIHCHWVFSMIPSFILKLLFGKKIILSVRESNPKKINESYVLRSLLGKADAIVSNNDSYFRQLLKSGANRNDLYKILNGVNTAFKKKVVINDIHKKNIGDDDLLICSVGYLIDRKSPLELFNSFKELKKKYGNLKIIYIGDGELAKVLKSLIISNNFEEDVLLAGVLLPNEICGWLNRSDLFCLYSKNDGIANSVVEAMACKVPVVTSDVGGFPEIIENKYSGMIVPRGQPDKLTPAIDYLLKNRARAQKIGERGSLNLIKRGIDWRINARLHKKLYRRVLMNNV